MKLKLDERAVLAWLALATLAATCGFLWRLHEAMAAFRQDAAQLAGDGQ